MTGFGVPARASVSQSMPRTETTPDSWWPRRAIRVGTAFVVVLLVYATLVRPWHQHWGATRAEIACVMPGDNLVIAPQEITTRAISIRAQPEHIWPWLAQMGRGRGGLYSYDGLDRLFGVLDGPSADSILPQFQGLAAGDTIPVGGSAGWPVAIATRNETLLLNVDEKGARVTWVFALVPISATETRLVTRVRARLPHRWSTPFVLAVLDPTEFLMVRRHLLGIRERAERLARAGMTR